MTRQRVEPDDTFLTDAEIAKLTGYAKPSLQVEHLRKIGIPFFPNRRGEPIVPRTAIEGRDNSRPKERKKWSPPVLEDNDGQKAH